MIVYVIKVRSRPFEAGFLHSMGRRAPEVPVILTSVRAFLRFPGRLR